MPQIAQPVDKKTRAVEVGVAALLAVAFMAISLWRCKPFAPGSDPREQIGIIVAAGLTLIMYSFLYRDNALFKIAENLYVGVALGYGAILTWRGGLRPEVYEPLFDAPTSDALWHAIAHRSIPILLGILLVTRLSRNYGWLSRYSYATMVGWGAGVGIPIVMHTYILQQLHSAILPMTAVIKGTAPGFFSTQWFSEIGLPILNGLVVMVGTVAVLFYFFFSIEHKRIGGAVSKIGIWFLMVSFGASFGYTVMGRISLLIGRVQFLLFDWLKIAHK